MTVPYSLSARIAPVLIVCLPLALTVLAWFPDQRAGWGALSATGTAGLASAVMMLISQLGRDAGKQKEPGLWKSWGGKPSTQLLRHRNSHLDPNTRRRYHKRLGELVEMTLPSAEQEQENPAAADHAYDSCVRWLIAHTRDTKRFSVLFKENVSYGFRRNLWGLRPAGILLAAIGVIGAAVPLCLSWSESLQVAAAVATLVNAILLASWCLRFSASWVKVPAFRYAEELLAAVDVLRPE